MNSRILSTAVALSLAIGAADRACAQSIDYGALEQLFDEPVTTSATGTPQRVTEAPADMTIITQDDIRRSGATDLPTILSRVPGIDILQWGADHADLGVRGYDQIYSPRLLVLIDGREVYLDNYGYTSWASLPVTLPEIRQIEVVRGPNSALFGFNAVGGVINIITFDPKYDRANALELHAGTREQAGGSGVSTLHLGDRLAARFSAGAERQDEWKNDAGYPDPWRAHAMADLAVQLAPRTELRLDGSWSRAGSMELVPSTSYVLAAYTTTSVMGTLTSDTPYGQIQARSYINRLDNSNGTPLGSLHFKNRITVASLQYLFKIGARNTVRLGFEYRDNWENTTPLDQGRIGYRVLAPSGMWSWAASDRLSLTAALRLDHMSLMRVGSAPPEFAYAQASLWSRTSDSVSANLGAVFKLTELDTLRASYGRGIQSPTLLELGGLQLDYAPGLTLGGNPYLRPSVISNYELSFDRTIAPLGIKAGAKAFVQQTDDIKGAWSADGLAPLSSGGVEIVYANASRSTMAGFELSASGGVSKGFHWNADATYTTVKDTPFGRADLIAREIAFSRTTPRFRGNLAAGWADGRWAVDGYLHYVSAFEAYPLLGSLERTPGYATLAARVAYAVSPSLTLALSGQNLGAERQAQGLASGLQAERRILFGVSRTW